MKPTRLNFGFADWDALNWKESSVLQVIQWSYIYSCGLSWTADACVERAECVSDLIVCYSLAPPQCLPLIGECPAFLHLPSAWQHPAVPLCTLTGPFALPQCGDFMHPYVCCVHNWRCVYICAVVLSAVVIYWHQCISWLVAACTLQLIHHPLDPMFPSLASCSYGSESFILLHICVF